jgi:hypothetical protein
MKLGRSIVLYDSLEACMRAFFGGSRPPRDGAWTWQDADGEIHELSMVKSRAAIRRRGCWAWVENKTTIHAWISDRAAPRKVFRMLAHEIGHMERPYHRDLAEERKANKYARVALAAWDAMADVTAKGTGS